jgi:hypothetical protein
MRENKNSVLNILGITAMLLVIAITEWARKDTIEIIQFLDYVMLVSIGVIIYCLPDFIANLLKSKTEKWYYSSEFLTISLLLFLSISGLVLPRNIFNVLKYVLFPLSVFLLIRELFLFFKGKNFLPLVAGISLIILVLLIFYSRGYESPLFYEKILLGTAHIDVLFFGSISNIFSTVGYSSTGLDGCPYFPYHWGSYALFGGLQQWVGLNSLLFINVAFPAVFIGLFFKIFTLFLANFFQYKSEIEVDLLFVFTVLVFLYSLPLFAFKTGSPASIINNCVAFIFTFQYLSVLLRFTEIYKNKSGSFIPFHFIFYSIIHVVLLISIKISVGFILTASLLYLFLRYRKNIRFSQQIQIIFSTILIIVFTYLFVFPEARTTIQSNIVERYFYLWFLSDSFLSYLLGAFIFFIIILKENSIRSVNELIQVIQTKKYIDLELLFITAIIGFTAGIYVSSNPSDVSYFASFQYYLSIAYIIYFLFKAYNKFNSSKKARHIFLFSIVCFSLLSRPDLLKYQDGFFQFLDVKKKSEQLSEYQIILNDLLIELHNLEKENNKKKKCIFIPQSEEWYYKSQEYRPKGSPMVVPAITGIPLIDGIPDSIMNSGYNYYSYYYYRGKDHVQVSNVSEAISSAKLKGYDKMFVFKEIDGKLEKEVYSLFD